MGDPTTTDTEPTDRRADTARGAHTPATSLTTTTNVHPVDEGLPAPRLAALGLQHVLVMYARCTPARSRCH